MTWKKRTRWTQEDRPWSQTHILLTIYSTLGQVSDLMICIFHKTKITFIKWNNIFKRPRTHLPNDGQSANRIAVIGSSHGPHPALSHAHGSPGTSSQNTVSFPPTEAALHLFVWLIDLINIYLLYWTMNSTSIEITHPFSYLCILRSYQSGWHTVGIWKIFMNEEIKEGKGHVCLAHY